LAEEPLPVFDAPLPGAERIVSGLSNLGHQRHAFRAYASIDKEMIKAKQKDEKQTASYFSPSKP